MLEKKCHAGEGQEGVLRGSHLHRGAPTCLRDGSENGEQPPKVIFQVSLSPPVREELSPLPGPQAVLCSSRVYPGKRILAQGGVR